MTSLKRPKAPGVYTGQHITDGRDEATESVPGLKNAKQRLYLVKETGMNSDVTNALASLSIFDTPVISTVIYGIQVTTNEITLNQLRTQLKKDIIIFVAITS